VPSEEVPLRGMSSTQTEPNALFSVIAELLCWCSWRRCSARVCYG
jgi:hypothetical protein